MQELQFQHDKKVWCVYILQTVSGNMAVKTIVWL